MKTIINILVFTLLLSATVKGSIIPFYSEHSRDLLGISVSGIGDFNGDGYDDFISGASQFETSGIYNGAAYIYFGDKTISPSTTPSVRIEGIDSRNLGSSVSGNFDFNSDGFKDIIIGADGYFNGFTGRAYIFFGRCDPPAVLYANQADVIIEGEGQYDRFGFSVSRAGDINGDCIDDIMIGAYQANYGQGKVYIFHGQKNYPSSPTVIPATNADLIINGIGYSDYLGYSVSALGDINGDNIDDIIVGVPVFGTPTGFVNIYNGGHIMDNVADKVFTGPGGGSYSDFGISVAGLGDVNGNGSNDFIISDWAYPSLAYGSAYVYDGTTIPVVNAFTPTLLFDITGEQTLGGDGRFGCFCSGIGDYDGDGLNDFVIGNHQFDGGTTPYYGGRVYRFSGSATPQVINASTGSQMHYSGPGLYDRMGSSTGWAGDINGDGRNDALWGAFAFHNSSPFIGGTFLDLSTSATTSFTTLYLKAFIQGFYNSSTHSQTPTMVKVCLYDIQCKLIDEKNVLLSSSGDAIDANNISTLTPGIKFNNLTKDTKEYYIVIKSLCNSFITTWSRLPIAMKKGGIFGNALSPVDFSSSANQTYGTNSEIQVDNSPGVFAIYSGDVNGDGFIDASDMSAVENDACTGVTGECCLKTDLNGDGVVCAADLSIVENNLNLSVTYQSPCSCPGQ